jgi:cytochrome c biogenesis protein CcmG/thiol:disulfide interchange protein DsbE
MDLPEREARETEDTELVGLVEHAPGAPAPDTPAPDEPAPDEPALDAPAPDAPAPDEPAPDAPAAGARWHNALLVGLAILSVGLGFALGRVLRGQAPASAFPAAANPTLVGATGAAEGDPSSMVGDAGALGGHQLLGASAPPFTMQDVVTGEDVSLSDFAGKPVLVNFWATWCPPCRLEMPWLQAAADEFAEAGLVVLAVNSGERMPAEEAPDAIRAFREAYGLTFPVLHGPAAEAVQSQWGVWGLPASFIVDRTGKVVDAQIGMYPSQDDLRQRLSTLVQAP